MDPKKYWFFGSKLNSVLLIVLIVLMVVAIRWMYQDKETYWFGMNRETQELAKTENRTYESYDPTTSETSDTSDWKTGTYGGLTFKYPPTFIFKTSQYERRPGSGYETDAKITDVVSNNYIQFGDYFGASSAWYECGQQGVTVGDGNGNAVFPCAVIKNIQITAIYNNGKSDSQFASVFRQIVATIK